MLTNKRDGARPSFKFPNGGGRIPFPYLEPILQIFVLKSTLSKGIRPKSQKIGSKYAAEIHPSDILSGIRDQKPASGTLAPPGGGDHGQ